MHAMRMWGIFLVMALCTTAVVHGQSLGEAARKEEERRKKSAEAGVKTHVIDETELHNGTAGKGTFSNSGSVPTASPEPGGSGSGTAQSPKAPAAPAAPGSASGSDQLQAKITVWRGRYRPVKARVDSLEREIADLEARASRIGGIATDNSTPRDPRIRTDAERVVERLPQARKELAQARQQLSAIEEGARRDGVASGQL